MRPSSLTLATGSALAFALSGLVATSAMAINPDIQVPPSCGQILNSNGIALTDPIQIQGGVVDNASQTGCEFYVVDEGGSHYSFATPFINMPTAQQLAKLGFKTRAGFCFYES